MSTYEYRCKGCGFEFEKIQPISEHEHQHAPPPCPKCHSKHVEQVPASFQAVTEKKA